VIKSECSHHYVFSLQSVSHDPSEKCLVLLMFKMQNFFFQDIFIQQGWIKLNYFDQK